MQWLPFVATSLPAPLRPVLSRASPFLSCRCVLHVCAAERLTPTCCPRPVPRLALSRAPLCSLARCCPWCSPASWEHGELAVCCAWNWRRLRARMGGLAKRHGLLPSLLTAAHRRSESGSNRLPNWRPYTLPQTVAGPGRTCGRSACSSACLPRSSGPSSCPTERLCSGRPEEADVAAGLWSHSAAQLSGCNQPTRCGSQHQAAGCSGRLNCKTLVPHTPPNGSIRRR